MSLTLTSLNDLLKICGNEERDIPVMHVPFYANTFPLTYGYYKALSNDLRVSGITIEEKRKKLIKQKILTEDWKNEMPRFDRDARYNIFFADNAQKDRWSLKESFYYAKIFKYRHNFVLIEKPSLNILYSHAVPAKKLTLTIDALCSKLITASFKEIRIVSDIFPAAEKFRKDIVKSIGKNINSNSSNTIKRISVVMAKDRSLTDVFDSSNEIFKIYLFGTPLCEILKAASTKYKKVLYKPTPREEPTYLCIKSTTPDTVYMPFFHIRNFFVDNEYPIDGTPTNASLRNLDEAALKFLKIAESSFPAIQEHKFKLAFKESIKNHCQLVKLNDFFIEEHN